MTLRPSALVLAVVLAAVGLAANPPAPLVRQSAETPLAMAAADFDADGVADLAVGYETESGFRLAIHRGNVDAIYPNAPEAAARRQARAFTDAPFLPSPRVLEIADRPSHLGAGHFDGDASADLVVATGAELVFLLGDGAGGFKAPERVALPGEVTAFAVGEVNRRDLLEDVVVAVDGPEGPHALVFQGERGARGAEPASFPLPARGSSVALGPADEADWSYDAAIAAGDETVIVEGRDGAGEARVRVVAGATKADEVPEAGVDVVATLEMRLNADAVPDRVVLVAGDSTPQTILSAPRLNFVVSSLADSGMGTLREAITLANGNGGADSISFSVAGTINLMSALPTITDTVSIDATTAPGFAGTPVVSLNGAGTPGGTNGLTVSAPSCLVRGFAIQQFPNLGILLTAAGTMVEGNFVGTNAAGTVDLGNGSTGIQVNTSNCTIGGTVAAARNISSGNGAHGIAPSGGGSGNFVVGNFCGTNATGNTALGNSGTGIDINNSSNNTIGGPGAGDRNVICNNATNGITIFSNANANVVQGNRIGVGAAGAALGNANQGIRMHLANNNTIGGPAAGAGNTIANNGGIGVVVLQSTGDSIRGNSISNNSGGLGIDLDQNGPTPNDAGDGDGGANNLQNFAVVTAATNTLSFTRIDFTLDSTPNTTFEIDIYRNGGCDVSGFGEGEVYLGSIGAVTDGTGTVVGAGSVPSVPAGTIITATTTDSSGNTSEFSACVAAEDAADMFIGVDAMPVPVPAGTNVTLTVTVGNNGPGTATNPTWSMNPVSNSTFVSLSAPAGWTCMTPPAGGTGGITCNAASLPPAANAVFSVIWKVDEDTPPDTSIPVGVNTGSDSPDLELVNNALLLVVGTSVESDTSVMISDAPDPVTAGENLTYSISAQNNGPSIAPSVNVAFAVPTGTTFVSSSAPAGWSTSAPPVGGTGTVTFSNPSVPVSGSGAFTVVVKVGAGVAAGSTIDAAATVQSGSTDPNLGNNVAPTTTTVQAEADLAATLSDAPDPTVAGTDLAYTILVENNGPSDAQSVATSFPTPPGTTFVAASAPPGWSVMAPAVGAAGTVDFATASLAAGASATLTVTVHVDAGVPIGTSIPATATASSATPDPVPGNDAGMATTAVAAVADLGVTKSASVPTIMPGEEVTYTVTVTNAGPSAAASATLVDTLPDDVGFLSVAAPEGWSCTTPPLLASGTITCTAPSLPAGASAVFTVVVEARFGTPGGTVLTNTAAVSSAASDPNGANDAASATTTVGAPPSVDLSIAKTATPSTAVPGSAVTYSITVTNSGPAAAMNLTVTDPLPDGVLFVSAAPSDGASVTAPAPGTGGTVVATWTGATAVGQTRSLTIVVEVGASVSDQTLLANTATVSNTVADVDASNDQATASTTVVVDTTIPQADLSVSISDAPTSVDTGTLLEYSIVVSNAGPNTATGVTLSGSTPNGTRFVSLSTDQGTTTTPPVGGTGSFSVDLGEVEPGQSITIVLGVNVVAEGGVNVTNRVTVSSETNDPRAFNNQSSSVTNVVAGLDTQITWDPPLPCPNDCLNPPLHLQTSTAPPPQFRGIEIIGGLKGENVPKRRNTVIGYNIYRSNNPNVTASPANFFTSVPPNVTSLVVPTAPGGSFFTVTAQYPNGESDDTNAASGGIPEPQITGFTIRGNQVVITGSGFTDTVTVFVDGIPFKKGAKIKIRDGSPRIIQKGKLLTGQKVSSYLASQGNVILVSVLNTDTGIGTFLFRRE
jgi:uncharacterized repeat protein (TIGR01451 family)